MPSYLQYMEDQNRPYPIALKDDRNHLNIQVKMLILLMIQLVALLRKEQVTKVTKFNLIHHLAHAVIGSHGICHVSIFLPFFGCMKTGVGTPFQKPTRVVHT